MRSVLITLTLAATLAAGGAAWSRPDPAPPLESRARGPFHLVGMLRPKDVTAIEAQLNDLVRLVGGTLIRDPNPITAGSIIEVVVSRAEYSRLEAGLREIGDFTVETQAQSFPEQVRIAIRID